MNILSIDIQTTGRDIKNHQILQCAGVAFNIECDDIRQIQPTVTYIYHNEIVGNFDVISKRSELIKFIKERFDNLDSSNNIYSYDCRDIVVESDSALLGVLLGYGDYQFSCYETKQSKPFIIAGERLDSHVIPFLSSRDVSFSGAPIRNGRMEVGMLYASSNDECIPNVGCCFDRMGISRTPTSDSLIKAIDMIYLVDNKFNKFFYDVDIEHFRTEVLKNIHVDLDS